MIFSGYVYRFLDENGTVIYVGRTKDLNHRLLNHKHLPVECYTSVKKIEYLSFLTENDARIAEISLINKYKPIYNNEFKSGGNVSIPVDLSGYKWQEYNPVIYNFNNRKNDGLTNESRQEVNQKGVATFDESFLLPYENYFIRS